MTPTTVMKGIPSGKTTIVAETYLETALKKYTVGEAEIAELSEKCMALKVASVVDKEGCKIIRQARSGVRKKRMEVEETRKTEKKESLNFGRGIDARAKELTELLTPIEEYLMSQEKIVDDEELRIANEKARLAQEVIDKAEAIKKKEEEDAQAKIKADQEAESVRLDKIRIEQEEKERKLQEAQDKVDADKKAIVDQKEKEEGEKQRLINDKKILEEAAVKAKKDAEEKVKRAVEEKAEKDKALKIALDYATSILPDNEKLKALASKIESLEMPSLTHKESCVVLDDAKIYLDKAIEVLRK